MTMSDGVPVPTTPPVPAPASEPSTAQLPTDHGTGANAGQTQTVTDAGQDAGRRYTQEDIDRVVSERLNRQRAQLAREAEEGRLKAQQEWQRLATQHEARVKELEPQLEALQAGLEARDAELLKTVKAETKDWPPEAKALIPHEGDALAQMAAVDKARALVAKLGEPGEPNKSLVDREMDRLRATGTYGNRQPAPHP
jgi:DNA repair exonuclease SbcCD ATPase subunit